MGKRFRRRATENVPVWLVLLLVLVAEGCFVRRLAVNGLADALAASGDVFAADEDPELVRDAVPFALKTTETLLAQSPGNPGLLLAACRGFTQYAFAFVETDALLAEDRDFRAAERLRERAVRLYLRARGYCLESLGARYPGIAQRLALEPEPAAAQLAAKDVDLVYWTAASWGAALAAGPDRPELVADLPAVAALMRRVLAIDESYDDGAAHQVMIALDSLPEHMGGSEERARRHYARALELSGGHSAGPYVILAAGIAVGNQDRAEFERLLHAALDVDPDAVPSRRLENLIQQRRARCLLDRADDLFLGE